MQSEPLTKHDPETDSPGAGVNASSSTNASSQPNGTGVSAQQGNTNGQFPAPKTDKPRPHVCNTCGRSFARLEHLKRHERSHTKEKPFECPECTRCFARRDLLLRHQQKLHMTNATPRQRQSRRESVGGASVANGAKVRKNSMASTNMAGAARSMAQGRPRANTIAHIDIASLGLFDSNDPSAGRMNALGLGMGNHLGAGAAPLGIGDLDYRGMSTAVGNHGFPSLPRLDTHNVNNLDITNSLRTAPPQASFGGFDIDQIFTPNTTINPAALHFGGSGQIPSPNIPFGFEPSTNQQVPTDDDFGWMRNWNSHLVGGNDNENAIEESSPSRISSGDSPGDYSETMTNSQAGVHIPQNGLQFSRQEVVSPSQQNISNGPFQLDVLGFGLPDLKETVSPSSLPDPTPTGDAYFHQAMSRRQQHQQQQQQQQRLNGHAHQQSQPENMLAQTNISGGNVGFLGQPLPSFDSNSPSISSSSMTGSVRQSSVTSMSTDSITDSTRQALLNSLSQPSVFGSTGHRKYSQPNVSSPLLPGGATRSAGSGQGPSLPSTSDIKRYIDAFLQYTHPHLPICHIPTLSFDVTDIHSIPRSTSPPNSLADIQTTGGARCLILGMAAIGALYEYEHPASKELFDAAKKMISLSLEERRKADVAAAASGSAGVSETPLWLVQAMLLTVIYGHHCVDRIAADIASNHIAALVSLARAANLAQPPQSPERGDVELQGTNGHLLEGEKVVDDVHAQWLQWKVKEERKRCLFAIFFLSSLLCIAYNQTPAIMNSEILLDLPCEEELYRAESAEEWHRLGGLVAAENTTPFANALSNLLTANQRQVNNFPPSVYNSSNIMGVMQTGDDELRPSTFGCLILISALHNYIWETRSRHGGREWTMQETESMVAHIEPSLNAWQSAWKANDHHKLERPNPFGLGPLSADSIPLLDLAFVRLYVNLGRTAEAFWRRDFDQMAEALAGSENHGHLGESRGRRESMARAISDSPGQLDESLHQTRSLLLQGAEPPSPRRERHLRKAAFYAADSLSIACSYGLTYADPTAHELPIQSGICFFDCAQVLAEWSTTVQERAGRYLGVLGCNSIDYTQVPAIVLLESEDVELLRKIEHICHHMEDKRLHQENLLTMDINNFQGSSGGNGIGMVNHGIDLKVCGLGSRILRVTAMMLEKAVIWPITHVMAKALEVEASHMDRRAQHSVCQP